MLGVQGRDGTRARSDDSLAVGRVNDVARGKHAGNGSLRRTTLNRNRVVLGNLQLITNEFHARVRTDSNEQTLDLQAALRAIIGVGEGYRLQVALAVHSGHGRIPDNLDLRVIEDSLLHNLGGAESVAAVHQVHLGCEGGQEESLLQGGVATADHGNFLVFEEEAIAGGAPGNAITGETILALDVELTHLRTGGHDDGLGQVYRTVCGVNLLHVAGQLDLVDVLVANVGAETLSLLANVVHKLGALNTLDESGEVFHLGGVHEGAAGGERAGEEDRLQAGTCSVDCGGVAGGAGTHDDDVVDRRVGFYLGLRGCFLCGCGGEVQIAQSGASEEAS